MAKVLAPLFSNSASGALAQALVFFPWKGLNCVRKYVVPTNPNSTAQQAIRDKMRLAVAGVHTSMLAAAHPLDSEDRSAYALLGSLKPTPRTWFNSIVKQIVDQLVDSKYWYILSDMHCTPGVDQLSVAGWVTASVGGDPTSGKLWYGTSKSAMLSSIACTIAELNAGKVIPSLTTGTKYFVQFRPLLAAEYIGCNSGIYIGTPT